MFLNLGGKKYTLSAASVRLELGRPPVVGVWFRPGEHPERGKLVDWALAGEAGRFGGGEVAPLVCAGFGDGGDGPELSGFACPLGVFRWLAAGPPAGPTQVYQRGDADPDGWAWVNRLAGGRFGPPPVAVKDGFDAAFPVGSAVARPTGAGTADFLTATVALAAGVVPGVAGWSMTADPCQSLRLVASTGAPANVGWSPVGAWTPAEVGRGPGRATGRVQRTVRPTDAGDFLADVALGRIDGPGPVTVKGMPVFARAVEYRATDTDAGWVVTGEAEVGPVPPLGVPPAAVRLAGTFDRWVRGRTRAALAPVGDWVMMAADRDEPDPAGRLEADLLTPGKAMHLRRRSGDPLTAVVGVGLVPLAPGWPQKPDRRLEQYAAAVAGTVRATGDVIVDRDLTVRPNGGG